jgi:DNA-binding transcriptional LysR family regulator
MNNLSIGRLNVSSEETIDLNRLRSFVAVADAASFTRAARSLGVRKSSVSKAVAMLEGEIGARLFDRTSRAVALTDAGRELHRVARAALSALTEAMVSAKLSHREARGRVRLTCPPDFDDLIADYVFRFGERYPRVSVEVSLTMRTVDLVAEGFDLALRGGRLADSALVCQRVIRSELGLFAAPGYTERAEPLRAVSDLARHPCILVQAGGWGLTWRLHTGQKKATTVAPSRQILADDMRFAARLAARGAGIALLPVLTARPLVSAGTLVRVLPRASVPGVPLSLVSPARRLETAAVRLFRDGLLREPWLRARSS